MSNSQGRITIFLKMPYLGNISVFSISGTTGIQLDAHPATNFIACLSLCLLNIKPKDIPYS